MKIGYISADFGVPIFGHKGASTHVREMVNAFRRLGHEVFIVSPAMHIGKGEAFALKKGLNELASIPAPFFKLFEYPQGRQDNTGGLFFLQVPQAALRARMLAELDKWDHLRGKKSRVKPELRNQLYNLTLFESALAFFRRHTIDFIYERYALFGMAGIRIARELKIPHILEINAPLADEQQRWRGLEMRELARTTEREILCSTDRVLAVSNALKEFALSCNAPAERVAVLPNAVDPERFCAQIDGAEVRSRLSLEQKCVIGFIGSLKPWHGLESLLLAFARLHASHPHTHLLIVGDGPMRELLQANAVKNGLAETVTFTGNVHHCDVPRYLAAMDIALAPFAPMEQFYFSPLKIFEYMAMAKPVVAAQIGQVQEIIKEGETGKLFAPGDVDDLLRVVTQLVEDANSRKKLGQRAREWILAGHTWDHNARQVVQIVSYLMAAHE
ncbi:MAG: glycosyltransferase family 4 protein [Deferribacteres bacterium]|nr:glycosyltransferase family 4 protein [Deferribacteres bacterium]